MKKILFFTISLFSFFFFTNISLAQASCEITEVSFSPFSGNIMTSGVGRDFGKETTLTVETNGECDQLKVDIKEQTFTDGETTSNIVEIEDKPSSAFKIPSSNTLKILYHTSENQCNGNSWFDCQIFVDILKPDGSVHSTKNNIESLYNNGNPLQPGGLNFGAGIILAECDGGCDLNLPPASIDDPWEYLGSNSPTDGVCEIGEVIFTPNGNSSTGSTINVKLLPKNKTSCVDKPIVFKIYEYDSFEDNQIDSFWYNDKKLKLDSNGEFQASLRAGEDECTDEDVCEYYIEGGVFNFNGGGTTDFSTDLGNEKNIPDPYKGRLRYTCNGECNDKWKVLSINPNNLRGGCTVNNITINPTGFQTPTDSTAHSFINKTNANNPKVIVKVETIGCHQNSVPIEIEPYEWNGIDRDAEEVTLKTGLKEDGILNLIYTPGDTDCQLDEGETDGARCDYAFQVDTDSEVLFADEFYQSEYQEGDTGKISWLCTGPNLCNKTKWKLDSHDGVKTLASQIQTAEPVYDRTSPCYVAPGQTLANGKQAGPNGGYNDNCYELLASIPGIGVEQKIDGVGTGRFSIQNLADYQLGDYIQQLFNVALGILMVLSVVMIVVAGVEYMTVESIYGKSDAKKRITGAVTGLILALGIFVILQTINPRLLEINFGSGIDSVSIDVPTNLDSDQITNATIIQEVDYATALAKKLTSNKSEYTKAYQIADKLGIPHCIAKITLDKESAGDPKAIGHDEDVTLSGGTKSRKAFLLSEKKYDGTTFTGKGNTIKNNDVLDESKSHLGLDWRFSHGIGLTQMTFFPKQYFYEKSKQGYDYYEWVKKPEAFLSKTNNFNTRTINGKTYNPRDMLNVEKNIEAGLGLWTENYKVCKSVQGAFNRYLTGNCKKDAKWGEGNIRTQKYNQCVNA